METKIGSRKTQPINMAADKNDANTDERRYRQKSLCAQRFQAIVTAIAAFAGVIGLIILIGTLKATKKAADAANTQAHIAQQEFEASERPWVTISGTEVNGYPRDDKRISIAFEITNSGRSPASHVFFKNRELGPFGGKELGALVECKAKPIDAGVGILLVPNAPRAIQPILSDTLDSDTVEYIREQLGQKPKPAKPVNLHVQGLIFIGCIYYVWADRCYNTRFCQQYVPVASRVRPYGYFSYCNFNNDTDEDEHCQIHK